MSRHNMPAQLPRNNLNRRKALRGKVFLGGKLNYSNSAFSPDCTIRDISESGARISVNVVGPIPENIFLIGLRDGVVYDAEVIWRNPPQFGLRFKSLYPVDALPQTMHFLRQLWIESSRR